MRSGRLTLPAPPINVSIVTSEGIAIDATAASNDDRLFCYRHPDRETYVRCGRCDRPICTRCAMQGPVGFRCKNCGTLANDPLTTMRPTQILLGSLVALGGGAITGLIATQISFFGIFIAFFAGGIIAEAVIRVTGYKRGPIILGVVLGGIVAGILVGAAGSAVMFAAQMGSVEGVDPTTVGVRVFLFGSLPWIVLSAGAACFGAYSRLR